MVTAVVGAHWSFSVAYEYMPEEFLPVHFLLCAERAKLSAKTTRMILVVRPAMYFCVKGPVALGEKMLE